MVFEHGPQTLPPDSEAYTGRKRLFISHMKRSGTLLYGFLNLANGGGVQDKNILDLTIKGVFSKHIINPWRQLHSRSKHRLLNSWVHSGAKASTIGIPPL